MDRRKDLRASRPLLGEPRAAESEIDERHKDIAFAVQEQCELAMLSVVRMAVEKTRSRNLCLAGGVALNSKANGKILASGWWTRFLCNPPLQMTASRWARACPYLDNGGQLPQPRHAACYFGRGLTKNG
jgi:predicted NodU family carbamoyl transferase